MVLQALGVFVAAALVVYLALHRRNAGAGH
jgi:hypothetical protein